MIVENINLSVGGDIISFAHTSKLPTIIDSLSLKNNTNAKIALENAIKTDSSRKQIVQVAAASASSNLQNREPIFVVFENSQL